MKIIPGDKKKSNAFLVIIDKILTNIVKLEKIVIIFSVIMVLIGMNLLVVMRYIFKVDLQGIDEFILLFALWSYFISSAYATYEKSHITSDFIKESIKSPFIKNVIDFFIQIIVFFITAIFCYWAFQYFLLLIEKKPVSLVWKIPTYYTNSAVFFGLFLMLLFKVYHLFESGIKLVNSYKKGGNV